MFLKSVAFISGHSIRIGPAEKESLRIGDPREVESMELKSGLLHIRLREADTVVVPISNIRQFVELDPRK